MNGNDILKKSTISNLAFNERKRVKQKEGYQKYEPRVGYDFASKNLNVF